MKLLIVDDNAVNLRLLRAQLEGEGVQVIEARNGVEALALLDTEDPQGLGGVISDILMPEMDGYRLCLELRQRAGLAHLPFVLYTSTYNSPADRDLARTVGADAYLTKPAPVSQILGALSEAAQRRGMLPATAAPAPQVEAVLKQYNEALVNKLEEKLAELSLGNERLAYQLELTRNITDTAAVSIFVTDAAGLVTFMNAQAEATFGYSFESLQGRPLAGLIHRHDDEGLTMPAALDEAWQTAAGPAVRDREDTLYDRDGQPIPVLWSSAPIRLRDAPIGEVLTVQDMRERRRVEAALQDSEQFSRATLDALSAHIAILDHEGRVVGVNRAWRDFSQRAMSHTATAGEGADYLLACERSAASGEEAAGAFAAGIREMLAGRSGGFAQEYACDTADEPRWFVARFTAFHGQSGPRIVVSHEDITDRKLAADRVRAMNEQLEQRVAQRTRELLRVNRELEDTNLELDSFSYSASHDLRAPIRAIDGLCTLLQREHAQSLSSEGRRCLDLVRTSAQRMGVLVEDLLQFAKTARQPLDRKPVDLDTLLAAAMQDLQPEITARRIEMRIGQLPQVLGDAGLLRQVLGNLLGNAVKYTRRQPHPVIEVSGRYEGSTPVIEVKDNGAGFDMAYADRLFGVFQRLHRQDEFEGTGVGLAIVQRIVQRHGGKVWAAGEPGRGASFTFSLGDGS